MPETTILYDSDCGFCRWSLAKVLGWDRRGALRPVAITSDEGVSLLKELPEERRLASWHLVDRDGRLHSAGAAFPPLLRLLPGGGPLAALSARAPRLTERAYSFVAGHRSLWGRLVTSGAKRRADDRIATRSRAA
jgi:predicted DCC family thiol-disulfide oxidoreductase YuxK